MESDLDVLDDGGSFLAGKVLGCFKNVAVEQRHLEGVGHDLRLFPTPVHHMRCLCPLRLYSLGMGLASVAAGNYSSWLCHALMVGDSCLDG